ncbi:protein ECERIFERUM 16 [Raphanus sativus]|uniref:Protein ECERIFERUM 16 n=1 Tax=Raphanus sativus TaxID=3726 RepID=A0A6J0N2N4_RAPSA|nr:protein ECERIFERUM 16 [Raphanus sativus]XP_018478700.1 protein ECERIFERUM 16 [Raphanus sativus]
MDTKAMAKSKRAHTQHHSKKPHKPKAPEKLQGNQTKTPVQSRLSSNWDRYDDELNPGSETAPGDLLNQPADDAIVPKSKGADYLHLISEAQAESHSKIDINSDSLDDLLHDEFSRVVGSMISARGEGIVSWMEDDNFVVGEEEDGSASHHEPGFLSLDLNALEKMLEKVDVHERLYIDAELCTIQSKLSGGKEPCRSHTSQDVEAVTTRLSELVAQQESSGNIDSAVESPAESLDQVKHIPILTEKSSAIEADLDLLLNSFSGESNPVASAFSQKPPSAFETELDSLLNSHAGAEEPFNRPENPSNQKLNTTDFGDVLDDLLESTSLPIKPQGIQTSSSSAVGKSKVLDEFDSWLDTI